MKARDLLLATGLALAIVPPAAHASAKKGSKPTERRKGPGAARRDKAHHPDHRPRTLEGEGAGAPVTMRPAPPAPRAAPTKAQVGARLRTLIRSARRLDAPFKPLGLDDSYGGGEGGITVLRTRPAIAMRGKPGQKPLRYFWFHGAGQSTHNEMVTRLANAFDAAGVAVEIYSMPYMGEDFLASARLIEASPGKVLIGGHSAGGGPIEAIARALPHKLAGIVTVNTVNRPIAPGVPALHFVGENDMGGDRELRGLLPEKPRPEPVEEPERAKASAAKEDAKGKSDKKSKKGGLLGSLESGGRWFLDLDRPFTPPQPAEYEWGDKLVVARREGDRTTAVLKAGDHSARYRLKSDRDKERAQVSDETRAMNAALARTLGDFITENVK